MMKLAILGPTASGKSALAVAVARKIQGTVVNGDPFQSLAGIPIGTGQPGPDEQGGIPHVGYGCFPLSTVLNPADFGSQVRHWMVGLDPAVLVTGSGLYLRGIWEQLDPLPAVPGAIVAKVRSWQEAVGSRKLHRFLCGVDPVRAAELHTNDGARIIRALALHLATGRKPSDFHSGVQRTVPEGWRALLVQPSRARQRERVEHRVRTMVEAGWREEVERILGRGEAHELQRLRPLGYLHWLQGGEVEPRIVAETQAYAKRQSTWFRHQLPDIPVWDPDEDSLEDAFGKLRLR